MRSHPNPSKRDSIDKIIGILHKRMEEEDENPCDYVQNINQSILLARQRLPLSPSAQELRNILYLGRQQTFFSLQVEREKVGDKFIVKPFIFFDTIQCVCSNQNAFHRIRLQVRSSPISAYLRASYCYS